MPTNADYPYLTAEEMAARADAIVVGQLIDRKSIELDHESLHIGVVTVTEILKGDDHWRTIFIKLRPPGGLRSSADIELPANADGLWYLRDLGNGLFDTERPDSFFAREAAEERIASLRQ